MTSTDTHAWVTRTIFPQGGDSRRNQYILHFENSEDTEELADTFYELLKDFINEIGGQWRSPAVLAKDRFLIEGPKGFSIIEVARAYTQEEFDKLSGTEGELDISVFEQMFSQELPKEKSDERTKLND
jgi:hypothetical protein